MDYKSAKDIRKKSFGSLLAEQEGGLGTSLKKSISLKTQAKITGIKETFDPMNIAKKLTGGSNWAPAMLGKLTGRDHKAMEYFAGAKPKKGLGALLSGGTESTSTVELLGQIYEELRKTDENKRLELELKKNKQEELDEEENDRNAQLIKALTGRTTKPATRLEKKARRRIERKEEKKKVTEVAPKEKAKVPTKEVGKPTTPKVEIPKPTAPKVPTPKGPTPTIPTAGKVATGAAIIGAGALLMPSQSVAEVINKASEQVGVDKSLMYAMAKQESGFNPSAAAKTSSAKGLYQFIKGTWKNMVDKYGSKFPILKERGPEDAEANAVAGALFIKENSEYLIKNNIPVNATTIYAAHFLGASGAKTLLTADPNKSAAEIMPSAATANSYIFYDKNNNNKPRTVQQVIDVLFQKVGQYQERYSQALNVNNETGNRIDVAAKQNKDLKESLEKDKPPIIQNTTNSSSTTQTAPQSSPTKTKVDDRPAPIKKAQG